MMIAYFFETKIGKTKEFSQFFSALLVFLPIFDIGSICHIFSKLTYKINRDSSIKEKFFNN